MPAVRWAVAARGTACLGVVAALAGCGTTSSRSASSSVNVSGGTLSILISQPPGVASDRVAEDVVFAEKLAFAEQSGAASHDFRLLLTPVDRGETSDRARTAIENTGAVAYLGEIAPGSSQDSVGITNALDLPQVSPTDTALELTQSTSAVSGAPNTFYESQGTYGRTFLRVVPSSAIEAGADVRAMQSAGVHSLLVEDDGSDYGRAVAAAVRSDARGAGISLTTAPSGAGAVFVGAASPTAGARLVNAAATSTSSARLYGTSSLDASAFLSAVSPAAANRLLVSVPGVPTKDLTAAGRAFVSAFTTAYGHAPSDEAIFGYAAMSAVLAAIRNAGTGANDRTTLLDRLRDLRQSDSVLGDFSFSSSGSSNQSSFVFNRVRNGALVPVASPASG